MPRVKGGYVTRRRRKAVLKLAKGYYGSKHTIYKTAHEQVMRSLQYAFRDRKVKKRDFRKLWIQRINAAAKENGLKYSLFICGLSRAGVEVNRKMLAELAVSDPKAFTLLVETAKKGLEIKPNKVEEKVVVLTPQPKSAKAAKPAVAKAPKAEAPKKEAVKKVAPKAEAPKAAAVDFNSLTVAELKAMAKEKGITGISAMKKADLVAALSK